MSMLSNMAMRHKISQVSLSEWALWGGAGCLSWFLFGVLGPTVFGCVFLARVLRVDDQGASMDQQLQGNPALDYLEEQDLVSDNPENQVTVEWMVDRDDRWSHFDRPL